MRLRHRPLYLALMAALRLYVRQQHDWRPLLSERESPFDSVAGQRTPWENIP